MAADHHEALWIDLGTPLEETAEERAKREEADKAAPLKGSQEFMLWMHQPMTQAFFAFMGDQEANFKDAVCEMFIGGQVDERDPRAAHNPHVWRGQILALRDLQRITLAAIAGFYRQKRGLED